MKTIKVIANYGDLVSFKDYDDMWVVECAIIEDDGRVRVTKLPDGEGQNAVKYRNTGKKIINTQACSIVVDEPTIESVMPLMEAIKKELLFYNQHPNLTEKVVAFYMQEFSPQYEKAIEIANTIGHTVLLQVCTNNDQRFYLPIVKEDKVWDARVRYLIYKNYLPI